MLTSRDLIELEFRLSSPFARIPGRSRCRKARGWTFALRRLPRYGVPGVLSRGENRLAATVRQLRGSSRFPTNYRLRASSSLPPKSLQLEAQILWIEAFDLLQNECLWIPYELVHTKFIIPRPAGSGCFYASSNGLASGNTLLEATNHAICEVIERDATTRWYLLQEEELARVRIDLKTVSDPDCCALLSLFDKARIDVAVWDSTSELDVPCYVCTISDRERYPPLYASGGMGCHVDPSIALIRAMTEAAQGRLTMIAGSAR